MASTASDYPPPPPPPPTQLSSFRSHAVDRSIEFLSAARTALKIAQAGYHHAGRNNNNDDAERTLTEWLIDVNPTTLTLYQQHPNNATPYNTTIAENNNDENANDTAPSLVRDSHSLLRLLDTQLAELHTLVRRRGHTNDPTLEIQHIIERFQEGAHEIKAVCNALRLAGSRPPPPPPTTRTNAAAEYDNNSNSSSNNNNKTQYYSSNQRRKHYEIVSSQLEEYAHVRTDRLKAELGTRSQVLRDQSHRRKLLATGGGGSSSSGNTTSAAAAAAAAAAKITTTNVSLMNNASSAAQLQSPLFLTTTTTTTTATTAKGNTSTTTTSRIAPSSSSSSVASASSYPAHVGYGGGGGGGSSYSSGGRIISGYGGGGLHSGTTNTTSSLSSTTTAMGMLQRRQQQQQQQQQSNIQIDNGGGGEEYYDDKYSKLSSTTSSSSSSSMQEQIIQRREARDVKYRTQQARLAERTLVELGAMFNKMSTLISTQGEILVRIEDDVENAYNDINDGQNELVKVYGYTKSNRGLIIKIFCILLFFIVFMKLY